MEQISNNLSTILAVIAIITSIGNFIGAIRNRASRDTIQEETVEQMKKDNAELQNSVRAWQLETKLAIENAQKETKTIFDEMNQKMTSVSDAVIRLQQDGKWFQSIVETLKKT